MRGTDSSTRDVADRAGGTALRRDDTGFIDWPARARALRPLIEAAAPRIDSERALPVEVLDALHEAQLFRMLIPRDRGGAEVTPEIFVQVMEAIASADGSVGWCLGQGCGSNMTAAYLPEAAAHAVFDDPRAVMSWGAGIRGRAVAAPGGWRLTGDWSFASGSRHATWLGGMAPLFEADGTPLRLPDGSPKSSTLIFPRSAARITDDWQVIGLRGTGSDSYAVSDLFVPDAHTFVRTIGAAHPGTLYKLPLTHLYPLAFGAVGLGIGQAVLDAFIALARGKTPRGGQAMRDNAAIQSLLGHAEARVRAARALLRQTARDVYADLDAGGSLAEQHEVALRLSATYATQEALAVVDTLYHESGATAIFTANPFERRFRDIHAVAQQVQARRANFELVGQRLLGVTGAPLFL